MQLASTRRNEMLCLHSGRKEKTLKEAKSELKTFHDEIDNIGSLIKHTSEDEERYKTLVEAGALAENRYRDKMKERMNLERKAKSRKGRPARRRQRLQGLKMRRRPSRTVSRKNCYRVSTSLQGKNILEAEVSSLTFKRRRSSSLPGKRICVSSACQDARRGGDHRPSVVGLVPEDTPLIVNAVVSNMDIGFVKQARIVSSRWIPLTSKNMALSKERSKRYRPSTLRIRSKLVKR